MPSEVDIINFALTALGNISITDRNDNTKQAREANRIYDMTRDSEIALNNWNFAITRVLLPALVSVPAFSYSFSFQLPDDYLRVVQCGSCSPGATRAQYRTSEAALSDYKIEGKTISTNIGAPLELRYLRRVSDPNAFSPFFVTALGMRLAMRLARTLNASNTDKQNATADYRSAVMEAIRANAIEMPPDRIPDGNFILSRYPG